MTTKRLLNDVTILKEEKEEMAKQNPIKKRISLDSDSDGQVGGNSSHNRSKRRDSSASARLSYSSTSTSSSSESILSSMEASNTSDILPRNATKISALQSPIDFLIDKNSSEIPIPIACQEDKKEFTVDKGQKSYKGPQDDARRISTLERDQSPVNTSFESELTPADSKTSSSSSSSSSVLSGERGDEDNSTARRSKRNKSSTSI